MEEKSIMSLPVKFGEYNQNAKTQEQFENWYQANENFRQKKYKEGILNMLSYLYDAAEQNVQYAPYEDGISFEIFQGSTKLEGSYLNETFYANNVIAGLENISPVVMRKALDKNGKLLYSKIGLDDNNRLLMILDIPAKDLNAEVVYYGVREALLQTDEMDDALADNFGRKAVTVLHDFKHPVPPEEAHLKYRYFIKWIEETLELLSRNNRSGLHESSAFLTLNLLHRIHYLCATKGGLNTRLFNINTVYWRNVQDKKLSIAEVLQKQIQMFAELKKMNEVEFAQYLYRTRDTFTGRGALDIPGMADEIKNGVYQAKSFKKQGMDDYAFRIIEYSIGNLVFDFNVPLIVLDLYHLQMMVLHRDFFTELGMMPPVFKEDGITLNAEFVLSWLDKSKERGKIHFPDLQLDVSTINFDDTYSFCESVSTALFTGLSALK